MIVEVPRYGAVAVRLGDAQFDGFTVGEQHGKSTGNLRRAGAQRIRRVGRVWSLKTPRCRSTAYAAGVGWVRSGCAPRKRLAQQIANRAPLTVVGRAVTDNPPISLGFWVIV